MNPKSENSIVRRAPDPAPKSAGPVIVVGALIGIGMWLMLFGLAFTRSVSEYREDVILPLLVFALLSFSLGAWRPANWLVAATSLSLPTVIKHSTFFYWVYKQGDGFEMGYALDVAAVLLAAFGGTWLGKVLSRRIDG